MLLNIYLSNCYSGSILGKESSFNQTYINPPTKAILIIAISKMLLVILEVLG